MKYVIALLLPLFLLSCSTVKRNGYYQTVRYKTHIKSRKSTPRILDNRKNETSTIPSETLGVRPKSVEFSNGLVVDIPTLLDRKRIDKIHILPIPFRSYKNKSIKTGADEIKTGLLLDPEINNYNEPRGGGGVLIAIGLGLILLNIILWTTEAFIASYAAFLLWAGLGLVGIILIAVGIIQAVLYMS